MHTCINIYLKMARRWLIPANNMNTPNRISFELEKVRHINLYVALQLLLVKWSAAPNLARCWSTAKITFRAWKNLESVLRSVHTKETCRHQKFHRFSFSFIHSILTSFDSIFSFIIIIYSCLIFIIFNWLEVANGNWCSFLF